MRFSNKQYVGLALIVFVVITTVILSVTLRNEQQEQPEVVTILEPVEEVVPVASEATIGNSVLGREIKAFTFGDGEKHLLFVGGIHGGYEWNSVLLAYQLVDYLKANPDFIPEKVSVTVIPSLNPDGLHAVLGKEGRFTLADVPAGENNTGEGRFNANNVDLNRNFACKWQPESTWRGIPVSAGTSAFSEPEAQAIRDFILTHSPTAVAFFHSQSNAVYASECTQGVLPVTLEIMNAYARASGYRAVESFDAYEITGDAEGWLASIGIPAITVELSTHGTVEWERNIAGIEALISLYE